MSEEEKGKIYWWIIAAILGSTGVNTSLQLSAPIRHDPFTSKDARLMEQSIRGDMPPLVTRQKITHIENFLQLQHPGSFKPVKPGQW